MNTLLGLLAVAGGAAAVWHLGRAAFRFLRGGASGIWTEEMGRTHARHGDLTALEESREAHARASRDSRRAALEALAWLALLAAPTFTPWPRWLFASYALLWAVPLARQVRRPGAR